MVWFVLSAPMDCVGVKEYVERSEAVPHSIQALVGSLPGFTVAATSAELSVMLVAAPVVAVGADTASEVVKFATSPKVLPADESPSAW
jgi:hypothetical protein